MVDVAQGTGYGIGFVCADVTGKVENVFDKSLHTLFVCPARTRYRLLDEPGRIRKNPRPPPGGLINAQAKNLPQFKGGVCVFTQKYFFNGHLLRPVLLEQPVKPLPHNAQPLIYIHTPGGGTKPLNPPAFYPPPPRKQDHNR